MKKYLTTPIFYSNGKLHLGHLHTCFLGDFLKKSYNFYNFSVFFLTGSDEHGQKIENQAKKENLSPQELVNKNAFIFKKFMKDFDIDYDIFIRTTDFNHKENVLKIWKELEKKKYIYKDIYKGLYGEKDETFYQEDEVYIDINGNKYSKTTNNEVKELEEECFFFRLSLFKEKLLEFYKNSSIIIPNNLKIEIINYINNLKDLCISRNIDWGIKIPNEKSTIYVWIDALSNYLTSLGGFPNYNKDLWSTTLHIIGKDILIFHGVYWIAILMALDINPPLNILVHGWWLSNEKKMSKSIGNIIDPYLLIEEYNKDYIRYFCLRQNLIGQDGNFQINYFKEVINNELIGNFLNLIFRLFSLINKKNFKEIEIIPYCSNDILNIKEICFNFLEKCEIKKYLDLILLNSSDCNKYIEENFLWKNLNFKHLNFLIPKIDLLINLMYAFIPETIKKIKEMYFYEDNIFFLKKINHIFKKI